MKLRKLFTALVAGVMTLAAALSLAACASSGSKELKIIEIDLSSEQYGIAVAKGNDKLKTQVNAIVAELKGDGVEVDGRKVTFQSLYQAEMEATTPISIGDVKTKSTNRENELVVATNAEFAPFEYQVGTTFGGIDMQIAKILAQKMNKELVVLHMAFDMVTTSVGTEADVALAGLTINEDRKKVVDFSDPYYDTTQRIAVAADDTTFDDCKTEEDVKNVLKGLEGKTAGAAKAQTGYFFMVGNESFEFEGYQNIQTKQYNTIALAVQDLANGKLSLVCGDKDTLSAAVNAIGK